MSLERKELINLSLGLNAYESWEDLTADRSLEGWGFYLLDPEELVSEQKSSPFQRELRIKAIKDQRDRDRLALREASSLRIEAGLIKPFDLCEVGAYDGHRENFSLRELGALIAATGKSNEEILKFANSLAGQTRIIQFNEGSLEPAWGREGIFQKIADFMEKPVAGIGRHAVLRQEYLPRINRI